MPTDRTSQILNNAQAVDQAHRDWIAMLEGRVLPHTEPIRLAKPRHDPKGYTLLAWQGGELLGVAIATKVFQGGQWMLTTWLLEEPRRER